jgi:hypothetical protein
MAKEPMRRFYRVENWGGSWYVIKAHNKREARSHGVREFGHGSVKAVDLTDEAEAKSYMSQKGIEHVEDIDEA